ncbi:MAG: sugar transferase [Chitinophagaceae bacterium]
MYKFSKRVLDILIASTSLVLLSPLFLFCIIVLLFTGEQEVFFRQKRIGYKNRPFGIWKFATMVKNSPNIGTGAITLRNDPRVTRFGKFLRISKINELPQILNVLTGQMSIVGPRPLMGVSVALYPEDIRNKIYDAKPGMTGIGSLIFRDEEKLVSEAADPHAMYASIYPYKGALEIWYQQKASFTTDCLIIFLTAWTIIFHKSQLVGRVFKDLPIRNF